LSEEVESVSSAKRKGRPKKSDVVSRKKGTTGLTRGRPKGDAAIINEYKSRMLTSPKSRKVLESIFDAALNDDHKNQAAAWKLVMDRILPTAVFEKDVVKGAGRSAIQINITGVGGDTTVVSASDDDLEGDYIDG
jgi:hypothetical protein|tara:strand:- start:702 stop:1106 length:405 start_codon:yes stop_codon:yes gene_type:complete